MARMYYTDKQYKELLKHLIIFYSGQEKVNNHILEEFDKQGVRYKKKAMDTGDYSFMIESCPELGFPHDTYFIDELTIERKNSVSELAGCFANGNGSDRFIKNARTLVTLVMR